MNSTCSNAGDLVLDPAFGAGGIGLVAINTGQRALLFEKDRNDH
jgi:DNA modification methylase